MSEAVGTKTETPKKAKHGRSPAYPGISLRKAVEKVRALYDAEGKYAVPQASAFKAWGFGEKSSGGRETKAALRYFGLISVHGENDATKVQVTGSALHILLDDREDQSQKKGLLRQLALMPTIHKTLFAEFPEGIKSDATVRHFLIHEQGFSPQAAGDLVAEFKDTAEFVGLYQPKMELDKADEKDEDSIVAKVGDFVQWTSNGVDQFSPARKVVSLSEDGLYLQVQGSPTGIPMTEVTVVDPPKPPALPTPPATKSHSETASEAGDAHDINVYLTGKRLQITADVDAAGLQKLKDVLDKYGEILKLLQ